MLARERAAILRRWYELIVENADELGAIVTAEQGKPFAEARGEVIYGAGFVEWFAEEAKRAYGDVVPTNQHGRRTVSIKQPIGVCAAITPWNFPSAMILRKAGPALAAGCTMVLKPASETPLSALALAELAEQAGIPAGVFNVVHGPAQEVGAVLTSHPDVRALTFTGSTAVGKLLAAQCAGTVKRMLLELGGNAPLIVFDDADIDLAVDRRDGVQVPQRRTDLCLRQPHPRAGRVSTTSSSPRLTQAAAGAQASAPGTSPMSLRAR